MTCARNRQMLDAWIDQELDSATCAELAQHVAACTVCSTLLAERQALRQRIKSNAPYFAAPASLRPAVIRALEAAQQKPSRPQPARRPSRWQVLALTGCSAVASALLTVWMLRAPVDSTFSPWPEQVVAHHVASLGDPRHMIEVASTDRHTIKPWFHGKLDFAPMVADLSADGYVLQGARQERLDPQPTAALVYQWREHPITLFMTRTALAEPITIKTIRGFSVATWAAGGVRFAAVADTDVREMERFARLLQATR